MRSAHRAPVIGARTLRAVRSTLRNTRRALLTMRPTWAPLLAAVVVVTPTAAALATWATLPPTGGALHLPRVQMALGVGSVGAAAAEPTATADPRLQPTPASAGMYASPGGPPDIGPPSYLTPGLVPHWPQIDRAAREHGLDPWAWAAVVVVECPLGVNSLPVPSCQYNNGSLAGGLAQITDDTADVIAGQSGYPCRAQKFDPMTSLRCGAFHFRDLLAASGVWRADDELPALQVASIAYNAGAGSSAYRGARAEAQAGRDVCGGIPGGFDSQTHRYCAMMAEMWGVALAERGTAPADAPAAAAPWRSPWGPRGAPGVAVPYLQAMNGEVGR